MSRGWFDTAALLPTMMGPLCFLLASVRGEWRGGVRMALDLWLAAALLRLAQELTWNRIAAAAAVIVLREVLSRSLPLRRPSARHG
ncbi:MAG TPA: hypothetical protein VK447_04870 [Myxococcaceae bacterium]|nr:hypothetical protein [Myxococcaceae bacterium]